MCVHACVCMRACVCLCDLTSRYEHFKQTMSSLTVCTRRDIIPRTENGTSHPVRGVMYTLIRRRRHSMFRHGVTSSCAESITVTNDVFSVSPEACPAGTTHERPDDCRMVSRGVCDQDSDCQHNQICCFTGCEGFCTHPDGENHPGK